VLPHKISRREVRDVGYQDQLPVKLKVPLKLGNVPVPWDRSV
jgi:hypothetical protein